MDTVNAKKIWATIYLRVNKFLKESHEVTRFANERASFLKINDINASINNTIDTGSAPQKRLKNIRAHFKELVAYIDINLNLKCQSIVSSQSQSQKYFFQFSYIRVCNSNERQDITQFALKRLPGG
jgi:hypothetical protein